MTIDFDSTQDLLKDVEVHLGRANGNIYHRIEGLDHVHDGQVMVRLKKKRFIILDYSTVPDPADYTRLADYPHAKIVEGAGRKKCIVASCPKVGVPVCLYDSEPSSTESLYLRSGMCFTCQRNLNEKRRTERKRTRSEDQPSVIYALGPTGTNKRFCLNGNTVQLHSDAIILNGPPAGVRPPADGYGLPEMGRDVQRHARDAVVHVDRLVAATTTPGNDLSPEAAAMEASLLGDDAAPGVPSLYDKAFKSLNQALFLLSQWKASWDAAVETATDPALADAVASAAAVAAAASEGPSSNMVSLLLAADKRQDEELSDDPFVYSS